MSKEPPSPGPDPLGDPPPKEDGVPFLAHDEIDLSKTHGSILREHNEPAEGRESVPLWLVGIFLALVFWGGAYLAYYSGGFRADTFNPRPGMEGRAEDSNDPATLGQRVFTQNCVLCHQATGLGVPGVYPPLAASEWVLGHGWHGDNHLVSIVLRGMQGPIEVRGAPFNNAMPGWSNLGDEEIAAVLTYIRSQWGNSATVITPEFVKQRREQTASRTTPWSPAELEAIARESAPSPAVIKGAEIRGKAAR